MQNKEKRLARVSLVIPICVGTYAIHLGKKVRGPRDPNSASLLHATDWMGMQHVLPAAGTAPLT